jgi:hypothetical protein
MRGFRRSVPQAFDRQAGPCGHQPHRPIPPPTIHALLHSGPEGMIVQACGGGNTTRLDSIRQPIPVELRKDFWSCLIQ